MGISLPWAEFISFWANWILVGALVVGVIATYGIVVSGNVKEAALKGELAAAGKDAADAIKQAAATNARAADIEKQAAELNARTVEAQSALERERIERLKLAEKLGPRHLADSDKALLMSAARGRDISLVIEVINDMEAGLFAEEIRDFLLSAGVSHVQLMGVGTMIPAPYGVIFFDPDGNDGEFAKEIHKSLPAAQVIKRGSSVPPGTEGGAETPLPGILVGLKPFQP